MLVRFRALRELVKTLDVLGEHFLLGAGSLPQYAAEEAAHAARLREQEAACQALEAKLVLEASAECEAGCADAALQDKLARLRDLDTKIERDALESERELVHVHVLQAEAEQMALALRAAGDRTAEHIENRKSYLATLIASQAQLDARIAEEEAAIAAIIVGELRAPAVAPAQVGPASAALLNKRRRMQPQSSAPSTSHIARVNGQGSAAGVRPQCATPRLSAAPEASHSQAPQAARRRNDAIDDGGAAFDFE